MKKLDQSGAVNWLLVSLILVILLLLGSLGAGYWAYSGRQDYKNNSDKKSAAAAQKAVEATQAADAIKFAQKAKEPYVKYVGPAAFGGLTVVYPKTWSAYVVESANGGNPVDAYFQPGFVPNVSDPTKNFTLRVMIDQTDYSTILSGFSGDAESGKVKVSPYSLAKLPKIIGSRIEGQITPQKQGVMIVLPLRNMTLKIWTESLDFKPDLDNIILPNLSFSP